MDDSRPAPIDPAASRRSAFTTAIVNAPDRKRLIVAGPGTGKTYAFRQALERAGDRGLALTFIRNLVRDLEQALGDIADVFTFHAFCKWLIHRAGGTDGLTAHFHLYPALMVLVARDLTYLGTGTVDSDGLRRRLHYLDGADGWIDAALERGDFYDAAGFEDVVYRALRHFQRSLADVPPYPLVVVDEYQDFSLLETSFIATLATASPVLIAGDDDQALYDFKHASAQYIRDLAVDPAFRQFALPYCSRCTQVVVDAVNDVIRVAVAGGHLADRLPKDYKCYLPEKSGDSTTYPKIIHARCSVETSQAPYVCRYVAEQISAIPAHEVALSWDRDYPTTLVVGPMHYVRRIHAYLIDHGFPQAVLRESHPTEVSALDAARYLAWHGRDNLGWRILMDVDPPGDAAVIRRVLGDGRPLIEALPGAYVDRHQPMIDLARLYATNGANGGADTAALAGILGCDVDDLAILRRPDEELASAEGDSEPDRSTPSIVCTSFVGAKGLSAGHVFVAGLVNGEFPKDPGAISDKEICEFIVALSRTRQQCHLLSNGRFATTGGLRESAFVAWVRPHLEPRTVNAAYWPATPRPARGGRRGRSAD